MSLVKHKKRHALINIAIICGTTLFMSNATAQESNSSISGTVTGAEGIIPVEGAILRIEELGRQTSSGSDGRYRFTGLRPGKYTLSVDYLGVSTQRYEIEVNADDHVSQMVPLGDDTEVILVSGNFTGINVARNMQRAADVVKDIVDSDLTGRFADQNIAESLQRLPGVNIDRSEGEGRFVTIRGLGPEFNSVSIDGVTIGTSSTGAPTGRSGESRAVALDLIPADLLETLEVSKTRTPDMDADSIGGAINVRALSAYDKGERFVSFNAQGVQQDYSGDSTPNFSARFSNFLDKDRKWGVAIAASYSKRKIEGNDLRNDNGLEYRRSFVDAGTLLEIDDEDNRPQFIRPEEIDQRRELGERTRLGYTFNVDYRPDNNNQYYFRYTGSQLEDLDTRIQTEWELRDAGSTANENLLIQERGGIVTDADLDLQIFFQDHEEEINTLSLGGEHYRGDWTIDYQFAYSKNEFDSDGVRGRFRERDNAIQWDVSDPQNPIVGPFQGNTDAPPLTEASSSDIRGDVTDLSNLDFDQLLYISDTSEDEVTSFEMNFSRHVEWNGMPGTIKFGAKHRKREKSNDRLEEYNIDIQDLLDAAEDEDTAGRDQLIAMLQSVGLNQRDLGDFNLFNPGGTAFSNDFNQFPELGPFSSLLWGLSDSLNTNRAFFTDGDTDLLAFNNLELFRNTYSTTESITAAYLMGTFEVNDKVRVTAGLRVEQTDWESGAYTSGRITPDGDVGDDVFPDDVDIPASFAEHDTDYTDVLPTLLVRYEPTDDIVLRASYTEAVQRPSFFDALPRADFDIELEGDEQDLSDLEVNSEVDHGNPGLRPAGASQWDASIAWYPNETTYLSAGVFYKTIDDFFIETELDDPESQGRIGLNVTPDFSVENQVTEEILLFSGIPISEFDVTINGDEATVYGLEIAYSQSFAFLESWASGFFIDSNVAFISSEAMLGDPRPDEELPLPNQADGTANVSFGWENNKVSMRVSWNWRDEILNSISSNEVEDRIREAYEQWDLKLNYSLTDHYQLTFDVTNLTEEKDVRVFRGDDISGRLFNRIEDYGRTYRLGVSGRF